MRRCFVLYSVKCYHFQIWGLKQMWQVRANNMFTYYSPIITVCTLLLFFWLQLISIVSVDPSYMCVWFICYKHPHVHYNIKCMVFLKCLTVVCSSHQVVDQIHILKRLVPWCGHSSLLEHCHGEHNILWNTLVVCIVHSMPEVPATILCHKLFSFHLTFFLCSTDV